MYTVPTSGIWATSKTYTAKLTVSDGANFAWLGSSVAFDGFSAVAGAYGAAIGSNFFQGAAYVFTEPPGGWTQNMTETAKLTASDGQAWDLFGYSVSANNGVAAVGSPGGRRRPSGAGRSLCIRRALRRLGERD